MLASTPLPVSVPAYKHRACSFRRRINSRIKPAEIIAESAPTSAEEIVSRAEAQRAALEEWYAERVARPRKPMNPALQSAISVREYQRAMANIRSIRNDARYASATPATNGGPDDQS